MRKTRSEFWYIFLACVFLSAGNVFAQEVAETAKATATQTDLPELIGSPSAKKQKKYRRKEAKAVKNRKERDVYIRHRLVELNTDILSKRDPLPLRNYDDSVDVAWPFEVLFTPFEGETYILSNHSSYKDKYAGIERYHWDGDILTLDRKKVGRYFIADVRGNLGGSRFVFDNNDFYTFGSIRAKNTIVLFQEALPF